MLFSNYIPMNFRFDVTTMRTYFDSKSQVGSAGWIKVEKEDEMVKLE